ncbi:MAG: YgiQ family radical SAM protein [Candidatus Sabulitectum sp.]|nr:YgiQ family radical SAM protein [Candidatus Sabulitectum sp.]
MNKALPMTAVEMRHRGWDQLDVLIVTGDAYVDHPSFGAAIIGRVLESRGYRVGIIAQPDWKDLDSFTVMGKPRLFVGVTSGNMDSMVNHYTSNNRLRSDDAYTPDGLPGKRPDRAVLKYTNCLQRSMKGVPVVLGGIEASLRRITHYDFWSDRLKKSILLDSKASVLVYGMGEKQIVEIARRIDTGSVLTGIPGTAIALHQGKYKSKDGDIVLPSHESLNSNPLELLELSKILEANQNPWCSSRLIQHTDSRVVVVEPPAEPLSSEEMDAVYDLPYTRLPHGSYRGEIPALTMIKDSITVVRGCSGGCTFCAIGLHQGKFITSRSWGSVLREAKKISSSSAFRGTISDLGGPTANMYGLGCNDPEQMKRCRRPSCLYPSICRHFRTDHSSYIDLLKKTGTVSGVKNVFISSGIRHDVALCDPLFMARLTSKNISGHLRIAPEHTHDRILALMRKPTREVWEKFAAEFKLNAGRSGRKQYIVPYIIAAFPGCTIGDMQAARSFLETQGAIPRQVQIFLPTPMTVATAMYFTGRSYPDGEPLRIPRKPSDKQQQKDMILYGTQGMKNLRRKDTVNRNVDHRKGFSSKPPGR